MNRRDFVFSWGRKMFFGFSWPITSLLTIIYFQSYIFPRSAGEWLFYLTGHIGQTGLITAALYFLGYCPIVFLVPSYYMSRIWGLLLILSANIYIFLDASTFAQYRYHLNSFIKDLIWQNSNVSSLIFFIIVAVIGVTLFFWFRGERLWRSMQARFSNPVKNWYLGLIAICLLISHFSFSTRISELFPLRNPFVSSENLKSNEDLKRFNYPAEELKCSESESYNLVFLVLDSLSMNEVTAETTPFFSHLSAYHSSFYPNHFSPSLKASDALFGLFYGIPATYSPSEKLPIFIQELIKKNYQINFFHSLPFMTANLAPVENKILEKWNEWSAGYKSSEATVPFFNFIYFERAKFESLSAVDKIMDSIVLDLQFKKLLSKTAIVVTAAQGLESGNPSVGKIQVPLFVMWPDRKFQSSSHVTNHYDVTPSLLKKLMGCKNKPENYSYGKILSEPGDKDWFIGGSENELVVFDTKKEIITVIKDNNYDSFRFDGSHISASEVRKDVILSSLKSVKRFYKR